MFFVNILIFYVVNLLDECRLFSCYVLLRLNVKVFFKCSWGLGQVHWVFITLFFFVSIRYICSAVFAVCIEDLRISPLFEDDIVNLVYVHIEIHFRYLMNINYLVIFVVLFLLFLCLFPLDSDSFVLSRVIFPCMARFIEFVFIFFIFEKSFNLAIFSNWRR